MKRIRFSCHGYNAPAYGCSEPGDNSGEYYRSDEVDEHHKLKQDINEMRRKIQGVAYYGERADGRDNRSFSPISSMVKNVFDIANHEGLSGEDRMTLMAYHIMLQYETLFDKVLDMEHNKVPAYVVIPDKEV